MDAILIAGPTASGKSGLALRLAARHGGEVVNADSMQVYDTLRVLTARPHADEMGGITHHLYGHVPAARLYSTGQWFEDMALTLANLKKRGALPVIVGGTGLYFHALFGGLSDIPAIPDDIRKAWRARLAAQGTPALHALLAERDPEMAATLKPNDGQRVLRALEVLEATGQSIRSFQSRSGPRLLDPSRTQRLLVMPERAELHARINERFRGMLDKGALDEVAALDRLGLDPALPVMKAIGVRELRGFIDGILDRKTAIERASAATRQYAKRQSTWFRNRLDGGWQVRDTDK